MPLKKVPKQLIPLLRGSVNTIVDHPVILIPFLTVAFIQLLVLEILYFSPRFPLSSFFNPIIATLWGGRFTHYPFHLMILPKLFQNIQVLIYIFITGYFIAVAVMLISAINGGHNMRFKHACRETLGRYVHIFSGALISFGVFFGLYKLYHYALNMLLQSSSVDGVFFTVKFILKNGASLANVLIGIFVTTLFAFVFPIIIIEKKKVFSAIGLNFKNLWGSFWYVFAIVLIPTLFYLPVFLLRTNMGQIAGATFPEMRVVALAVSVLVTMFIDVTVYTAITTYYLLKRERA